MGCPNTARFRALIVPDNSPERARSGPKVLRNKVYRARSFGGKSVFSARASSTNSGLPLNMCVCVSIGGHGIDRSQKDRRRRLRVGRVTAEFGSDRRRMPTKGVCVGKVQGERAFDIPHVAFSGSSTLRRGGGNSPVNRAGMLRPAGSWCTPRAVCNEHMRTCLPKGSNQKDDLERQTLLLTTSVALLSLVMGSDPREAWAPWDPRNERRRVTLCKPHQCSSDPTAQIGVSYRTSHCWHALHKAAELILWVPRRLGLSRCQIYRQGSEARHAEGGGMEGGVKEVANSPLDARLCTRLRWLRRRPPADALRPAERPSRSRRCRRRGSRRRAQARWG